MPDEHDEMKPNEMKLPQPKFTGTATNTPPPADDEQEGE